MDHEYHHFDAQTAFDVELELKGRQTKHVKLTKSEFRQLNRYLQQVDREVASKESLLDLPRKLQEIVENWMRMRI
jgi:hypothetical protein